MKIVVGALILKLLLKVVTISCSEFAESTRVVGWYNDTQW